MGKRLMHWLGFCCCLMLAIAATQAVALPTTPEEIKPIYVQPYALSQCLAPVPPMDRDTGIVIQDQKTLAARWLNTPDCQKQDKPSLDFNRDILLGRAFTIPGGCSRGGNGFTLSVTQDKRRRTYTHTITHGTGPCAGSSVHEIWVVASNPPLGYTVEFAKKQQNGLIVTCGYEEEW